MPLKQTYSLYASNDIVIKINDTRLNHIQRLEIHESINSTYRYGIVQFVDSMGEIESSELYGGNDICEVRIGSAYEESPRVFQMKIVDVKRSLEPRPNGSARRMMTTFNLVEEPVFNLMFNGQINKAWRDVNSTDVIRDIFSPSVLGDKFEAIDADESSFRFPRLICPFWNRTKLLKYLKPYSDDGPFLLFTTGNTENRKTRLNYKSMQNLMAGNAKETLTAGIEQDLNIYANNFIMEFPTWLDTISIMQGERVYNFQFGEGERKEVTYPQAGSYEFNSTDDQCFDAISSEYNESIKKVQSNADYASFYPEFSNQHHHVTIDVDYKDSIKAKMISRFFEKYYDQFEIKLTLPPFSQRTVGECYNINIPSFNEGDKDDKLSGKFLLKKISHIIYNEDNNVQKYRMDCSFVRTGYSKTVEDPKFQKL